MKNRFNNLTSKEWLPFQKSWFRHESYERTFRDIIRFFVKFDHETLLPTVLYLGPETRLVVMQKLADELEFELCLDIDQSYSYQLIIVDDLDQRVKNIDDVIGYKTTRLAEIQDGIQALAHRRFVCYLAPNVTDCGFPLAWEMSYDIAKMISLKDEKVACTLNQSYESSHYYCCFFRNDEKSPNEIPNASKCHFSFDIVATESPSDTWEILKPKRRSKTEILHPAKYPESLIEQFIKRFSKAGDNVFDPMSGTGSTQYAALLHGRNGYGTELSPFFAELANDRISRLIHPDQPELFNVAQSFDGLSWKIVEQDASHVEAADFPIIDYIITSPPYWNMLNMKGAEYQARRKEKGLQLNYSDDAADLGNMEDYNVFLEQLMSIYERMWDLLKPGGHMTVIVKNIKKKGKNYPFAYDICKILQERGWLLLPEFFWLQDDIRLAPYGYGNTFVSNTFHQYCLSFQKGKITPAN